MDGPPPPPLPAAGAPFANDFWNDVFVAWVNNPNDDASPNEVLAPLNNNALGLEVFGNQGVVISFEATIANEGIRERFSHIFSPTKYVKITFPDGRVFWDGAALTAAADYARSLGYPPVNYGPLYARHLGGSAAIALAADMNYPEGCAAIVYQVNGKRLVMIWGKDGRVYRSHQEACLAIDGANLAEITDLPHVARMEQAERLGFPRPWTVLHSPGRGEYFYVSPNGSRYGNREQALQAAGVVRVDQESLRDALFFLLYGIRLLKREEALLAADVRAPPSSESERIRHEDEMFLALEEELSQDENYRGSSSLFRSSFSSESLRTEIQNYATSTGMQFTFSKSTFRKFIEPGHVHRNEGNMEVVLSYLQSRDAIRQIVENHIQSAELVDTFLDNYQANVDVQWAEVDEGGNGGGDEMDVDGGGGEQAAV